MPLYPWILQPIWLSILVKISLLFSFLGTTTMPKEQPGTYTIVAKSYSNSYKKSLLWRTQNPTRQDWKGKTKEMWHSKNEHPDFLVLSFIFFHKVVSHRFLFSFVFILLSQRLVGSVHNSNKTSFQAENHLLTIFWLWKKKKYLIFSSA